MSVHWGDNFRCPECGLGGGYASVCESCKTAMPKKLECCYIGCNYSADFEIIDMAERRPDVGFTLACENHVGALLGHEIDLPEGARNEWSIRAISWAEHSHAAQKFSAVREP